MRIKEAQGARLGGMGGKSGQVELSENLKAAAANEFAADSVARISAGVMKLDRDSVAAQQDSQSKPREAPSYYANFPRH